MFNNSGSKLKTVAIITFVLGILTSVIFSCEYGFERDNAILGIVILVGFSILSYVGSLFVYGFGELIDGVMEILSKSYDIESQVYSVKQSLKSESSEEREKKEE